MNGNVRVHMGVVTYPGQELLGPQALRDPTVAPTPAPTEYPTMGRIYYSIYHRPPAREGEDGADTYVADNIIADNGGSWLGPDQQNQENATLYFIFDLDKLFYV